MPHMGYKLVSFKGCYEDPTSIEKKGEVACQKEDIKAYKNQF